MKRLVSLLLSCLLLSSCGTIVTPAKTPPEHLVSEAPPAQVLPAPGEMPELLPDSQEAGGENASEPSPEEGGGTPVETLPEPQRVVDPTRPMVALTFDDGPHPVCTPQLLDGLKKRDVKVTFFVTGENVESYPEIVKRASEEGHLIGNHTFHHVQLTAANSDDFKKEIISTNDIIQEVTGKETSFIRPPYGSWDKKYEKELNMFPVLWDVDPLDWCSTNVDKIVRSVLAGTKENSIILMHDSYDSTVTAALQVVDILKAEGYEFVTVDEILFD